jgi:glycosyltransferase involved in cell wall biosynthesis
MRPIVFNGKFYSGPLNGVHRVADCLIREVDALLAASDRPPAARIFIPTQRRWSPELKAIEVVEDRRASSQRWEQLLLPGLARGAVLVNLCNLAPVLHGHSVLMIHDAQFHLSDSSFGWLHGLRLRWLVPLMARRARRVLTVSEYSRLMLDVTRVVPRDAVSIVPNGGDHLDRIARCDDILADHAIEPGRFALLFGSRKLYKNVGVVLDAFRRPELRHLQLVVVGDSAERLRANGLDPPAGAICLGAVGDGVLKSLYAHALCLAFPSRTEGFGLPPVEAMRQGCPVIANPGGAIPEVCHDAAMYAGDSGEWAEAIVRLDQDGAFRAAKVAAGQARAARFTWARAGQILFDAVMDVAST